MKSCTHKSISQSITIPAGHLVLVDADGVQAVSTQGIKLGRSAARDVGARDGVLEKIANFCLEVHMRPQMTTLPEILSRHHLRRMVWPATIVGMTVASRHHHASTILVADLELVPCSGRCRCGRQPQKRCEG